MDSLPAVTLQDFEEARQQMLRVWAALRPVDRREVHDEANATAAALRGIAAGLEPRR
jgi:hypothetical protein